jgi:hypothetical protein
MCLYRSGRGRTLLLPDCEPVKFETGSTNQACPDLYSKTFLAATILAVPVEIHADPLIIIDLFSAIRQFEETFAASVAVDRRNSFGNTRKGEAVERSANFRE